MRHITIARLIVGKRHCRVLILGNMISGCIGIVQDLRRFVSAKELKNYILSNTLIPNNSKPNFKVLAVKSHKINREVRNGSSDFNT